MTILIITVAIDNIADLRLRQIYSARAICIALRPFRSCQHSTFVPQPSRDSALTSFVQLGAIRGTQRALVSLFDRTHKHVVAEATPALNLLGGCIKDDRERLQLGCCVLPKDRSFCHHVERLPSWFSTDNSGVAGASALVIMDVTKDERFRSCEVLEALSDVRFYATVPIVSPRGFTIVAYSVMDNEPRTLDPDRHALQFMNEMAATVKDHLAMVNTTRRSRKAERMIVGLGGFIEGKSILRHSWMEANAQFAASEQSGEAPEGQLNIVQQRVQEAAKEKGQAIHVFRDSYRRAEETWSHPSNSCSQGVDRSQRPRIVLYSENSVRTVLAGESLQDDTLSSSIKLVFSRAANLIWESVGAEGVMFLDANSNRFGSLVNRTSRKVSPSSEVPTSGSDGSTASESSLKHKLFGEPDSTFASKCLVEQPCTGTTVQFAFSEDSNDTSQNKPGSKHRGTTDNAYHIDERRSSSKKRNKSTFRQDADHLIKIFPEARNILFLPIWDSGKRRCFAGTLVWTNILEHIFTFENELVFVSAYANSIMAEIHRLDVDTAMNATQYGMIHTIESCGRTLLDTINNLLDVTFIDKYQKKTISPERKLRRGADCLACQFDGAGRAE
ncbi:hypothetical protein N7534_003538 [Penicillium rubens]|nr:hypothetical protein N7534_008368 [Penicillium rubens]KAJ5849394.1 hypothetical protein N7534_008083 [Penicillium rubens]KAJ5858261.1 hypothetical protein N7534_003538 [Penicillium rubens]